MKNISRNCKTDSKESFTIKHEKHSPDSILKISNKGETSQGPDFNGSSNSSVKRRRGLGKKTLEKQKSLLAIKPQLTLLRQKSASFTVACKCAKSKCLKMYCECFTAGRFCDQSCTCVNCHNIEENK